MSVQKLPSGRWRAQVYDPDSGKNVSVSRILNGPGTFRTKTEAKRAREQARARLDTLRTPPVTVREFWERWTTDPLFARPKESTNIHNRERTAPFVKQFGARPLVMVDDLVVVEWLAGGRRNGTVPALRAMLNDAASAKGGRLVERNPFAGLGIGKGPGRRNQAPPSEEQVWHLIDSARKVASPSFAAWLQVGAFAGLRCGELDALRPEHIDGGRSRISVESQFNAKTRTFTLPKNGKTRFAPLTAPARAALLALPTEEFCFTTIRGRHYTPSSRAYYWKAVRAATGWNGDAYLATRHFAGWYMINELEMPSEDVAIALGHEDGGDLVRRVYGHRDKDRALQRVVAAYDQAAENHARRTVRA